MVVESAGLSELAATIVAGVRPLAAVSPTMSPERGDIGETSATSGARVRLLPGVCADVQLEIGLARKGFVTLIALE